MKVSFNFCQVKLTRNGKTQMTSESSTGWVALLDISKGDSFWIWQNVVRFFFFFFFLGGAGGGFVVGFPRPARPPRALTPPHLPLLRLFGWMLLGFLFFGGGGVVFLQWHFKGISCSSVFECCDISLRRVCQKSWSWFVSVSLDQGRHSFHR